MGPIPSRCEVTIVGSAYPVRLRDLALWIFVCVLSVSLSCSSPSVQESGSPINVEQNHDHDRRALWDSLGKDEGFFIYMCGRHLGLTAVLSFRVFTEDVLASEGYEFPQDPAQLADYFRSIRQPLVQVVPGVLTNHPRRSHYEPDQNTMAALTYLRETIVTNQASRTFNMRLIGAEDFF